MPNTHAEITAIVHACFKSYVDKDRPAIEALISEDFHFTSPLDNRIDRNTYFERCWLNSENMAAFEFEHIVVSDEKAFITYECRLNDGKRFRNTELFTVRQGKVVDVEVYFGWLLPHEALTGSVTPEFRKSGVRPPYISPSAERPFVLSSVVNAVKNS